MKALVEQVKQWGIDKGLHRVGHLAQAKYTLKETAELLDAYADGNIEEINDAIGDILVTLIVGSSNDDSCYSATLDLLSNERITFAREVLVNPDSFSETYVRSLYNYLFLESMCEDGRQTSGNYACCINELNNALGSVNRLFSQKMTLQDCLQLAYNEIKDRTGKTNEDGHFIKD